MSLIHPARKFDFKSLSEGLADAKQKGLVSEHPGPDGLRLYCYTRQTTYDRLWEEFSLMSRGLILDFVAEHVVATPFPKFFNVGEGTQAIPDLPFETFEKVDGSLIILFHHSGEWRAATKGSFKSEQAQWAQSLISRHDLTALTPGTTYLAEAIYPENRIVVHYQESGLVLLGAYDEGGEELSYVELQSVGDRLGWRTAKRHSFASVSELIVHAEKLSASEEGFVLRFADGLRLKVKGDEYRRIHALISRCTPLAMWEAMQAGDDLESVRRDLPEEFWADFDGIVSRLKVNANNIIEATAREAAQFDGLSDKEVGLALPTIPAEVRSFIFPFRKNGGDLLCGRTRQLLFRSIRPTGNILAGYVPSYAMNRVMDEAI